MLRTLSENALFVLVLDRLVITLLLIVAGFLLRRYLEKSRARLAFENGVFRRICG